MQWNDHAKDHRMGGQELGTGQFFGVILILGRNGLYTCAETSSEPFRSDILFGGWWRAILASDQPCESEAWISIVRNRETKRKVERTHGNRRSSSQRRPLQNGKRSQTLISGINITPVGDVYQGSLAAKVSMLDAIAENFCKCFQAVPQLTIYSRVLEAHASTCEQLWYLVSSSLGGVEES
ncbi:predicted protein [Histoplasma capsulatum G186AR]|uniref:Uncharacterized protein n=1 Tax=Ajellomyces capsulatus (strain G186AR / H82 / ATCC MYA-2454 / RMSCC 2432) TaxID=447093 RepID=C0NDP6_AJECG|nr:uncharacterized protein HCBG_01989 [Histoplasma capsulatum G186AR]EEH10344.1 predicted protein [Histoplasma capsulatum G186AR]